MENEFFLTALNGIVPALPGTQMLKRVMRVVKPFQGRSALSFPVHSAFGGLPAGLAKL